MHEELHEISGKNMFRCGRAKSRRRSKISAVDRHHHHYFRYARNDNVNLRVSSNGGDKAEAGKGVTGRSPLLRTVSLNRRKLENSLTYKVSINHLLLGTFLGSRKYLTSSFVVLLLKRAESRNVSMASVN